MRTHGLNQVEAKKSAEQAWRDHVIDIGDQGLFPEAKSWYFGDNVPGKPREALNYMAGMPEYRRRLWDSAENNFAGFSLY